MDERKSGLSLNIQSWHVLGFVFAIFLISRLLNVLVFCLYDYVQESAFDSAREQYLRYFYNFDSGWYNEIANDGYHDEGLNREYPQSNYAFFPAYPIFTKWVASTLGIEVKLVGIALSNIFFVLVLWLLYRYCERRGASERASRLAILLIAFSPQNFVFSSMYTESQFLLLCLGSLALYERGNWVLAGVLAAMLSATRANGIFITVLFGWPILVELWNRKGDLRLAAGLLNERIGSIAAIAMAPIGLFAYWWYCFLKTGDAFAQKSTAFHGWGRGLEFPWVNLFNFFRMGFDSIFWTLGSLLFLGASMLLLRQRHFGDFLFCLANFGLFYSTMIPSSQIRYSIVLFPIFMALARYSESRPVLLAFLIALFQTVNVVLQFAWLDGSALAN